MTVERIENLNIYGKRPENISPQEWSSAIEYELTGDISLFWDVIKRSNKAEKRYNWQKPIILDALKAMTFESCPRIIDSDGNVYLTLAHGQNSGWFITVPKDGGLGFAGGGRTYIITPQDKSTLAIIDYNIKSGEEEIQYISTDILKSAISENRRIDFPVFKQNTANTGFGE